MLSIDMLRFLFMYFLFICKHKLCWKSPKGGNKVWMNEKSFVDVEGIYNEA